MRLVPSRRVREEFQLVYELKGAQKAVDFLAKYYKVRRMKIVVDGRKVGGKYLAVYQDNVSYFKRRSLKKRIVLHEFYHHLANNNVVSSEGEERNAEKYAREMIKII
jgi:hypothetical protein